LNNGDVFYFSEDTETPVGNLQRWLRALSGQNEDIPEVFIDGIYGEETRRAVAAFQRINGIPETGEVDLNTFDSIYRAYREYLLDNEELGYSPDFDSFEGKRMSFGDEFDDIFVLQVLLNTVALDDERYYVRPTGRFDEDTLRSVNLLQGALGRESEGFVNQRLWNELVKLTRKPQYYT
jgi:peptidoglycan hydrolase-like protein with peptidoglycan-binding domain